MKNKFTSLVFLSLIFLSMVPIKHYADDKKSDKVQESLNTFLGTNNAGKEFYLSFHPGPKSGTDDKIKIFVCSDYDTKVTLEIPDKNILMEHDLDKYKVHVFELTPDEALCDSKAQFEDAENATIYKENAIHLVSEEPIVAFGLAEFSYGSEGFLAIPTSWLGTDYVVSAYPDPDFEGMVLPSYTSIIAAYDGTSVDITLTANTGIDLAGATRTEVLNKGDVFLIPGKGAGSDLSGTIISAQKPVAVISGNYCAAVPEDNDACNYTIEQEIPQHAWGSEFHVLPVEGRENSSILRIYGKEYTKVYRNGSQIGIVYPYGDGPDPFLTIRADDNNKACVISADHPIIITQYNTGNEVDDYSHPFQMILTPVEQYRNKMVFATPESVTGNKFDRNIISIIYKANEDGSIPDDIEFGTTSSGLVTWTKLNEMGVSGTKISLGPEDNYYYAMIEPDVSGSYIINSDNEIAAYAYGFSDAAAYGFPAGLGLLNKASNDSIPPLVKIIKRECDGDTYGTVTDLPQDGAMLAPIKIIKNESVNINSFEVDAFIPGQTQTTSWRIFIDNHQEYAKATLIFADFNDNVTPRVLEYFPPDLSIIPEVLDFGTFNPGENLTRELYIINNAVDGSEMIDRSYFANNLGAFEVVSDNLPYELKAGDTLKIEVKFTAGEKGEHNDRIVFLTDCDFSVEAQLKAKVLWPVMAIGKANFGEVSKGGSSVIRDSIVNSGDGSFTLFSDKVINKGAFEIEFIRDYGEIEPGEAALFDVTFNPQDETSYTESVIFSSNAAEGDSVYVMSGDGVKPGLIVPTLVEWDNKRINRPGIDDQTASELRFILKNTGSQDLTINDVTIDVVEGNLTSFPNLTAALFKGDIKKGDSVEIIVEFLPMQYGDNEILLTYDYTGSEAKKTILKGTGVLPRINMKSSLDFGKTVINDNGKPSVNSFELTNTDWDFADKLYFDGFEVLIDPQAVGIDNFGSEGFRITNADEFPEYLLPGEKFEVGLEFVAQKEGPAQAIIKTLSDAEENKEIELNGTGVKYDIDVEINSNPGPICLGESDTIKCTITNLSMNDILLSDCEFENYAYYEIEDNTDVNLNLEPNKPVEINVIFTPDKTGDYQTDLIFYMDNFNEIKRVTIYNSAVQFQVKTYISPAIIEGEVGMTSNFSVLISSEEDLTVANLEEFEVIVNYESSFLKVNPALIESGSGLLGNYTYKINYIDDLNGEFSVKFTRNPGGVLLKGSAELLKAGLDVYLPYNAEDNYTEISQDLIIANPLAVDNSEKEGAILTVAPVCANRLMKLNFSSYHTEFLGFSPNPAQKDYVDIHFSQSFDSFTDIRLFNVAGKVESVLLSKEIDAGNYTLRAGLDGIPNGVYWCRMSNGKYIETKRLIINK